MEYLFRSIIFGWENDQWSQILPFRSNIPRPILLIKATADAEYEIH